MFSNTTIGVLFILVATAWLIQSLLGYWQIADIQKNHKHLYNTYAKECCIGYGHVKGKLLAKGCLVMLAVNRDCVVVDAAILEGRTILNRMKKAPEYIGTNVVPYCGKQQYTKRQNFLKNLFSQKDKGLTTKEKALYAAADHVCQHIQNVKAA